MNTTDISTTNTNPANTSQTASQTGTSGVEANHTAQAWASICKIEDIPRAGSRVVKRGGAGDIAVFRAWDDRVFALLDRCPHKGGPLSAGLVHGHAVTCPLHGWTIDLADGRAQAPDEGCSRHIAVRVEGGTVYLDLAGRPPGGDLDQKRSPAAQATADSP